MRLSQLTIASFATLGLAGGALAQDAGPAGKPLSGDPAVTFDKEGFTVRSADDEVKYNIGGRLHLDFGDGSKQTPLYPNFFDRNLLVRRARIETQLTVKDKITAAFQYEFASRTQPIQDAAIAYTGLNDVLFTLGNFKEPFSLDELTSDNTIMFIERNLADALTPARNTGFAVGATDDERWTAVAGIYGGNINSGGLDDNGVAGTARFTFAPIKTDNQVLHLGVAGGFRGYDDNHTLSFSAFPEANVGGVRFIKTGDIADVDGLSRLGVEGAYERDAFRVQGEWIGAHVDRRNGTDPTFQGGYVQGSLVLNGKGAKYRLQPEYGSEYATFGAVPVAEEQRIGKGGFGVWEVAGRFSYLDLQSRSVQGGRERDVTAGLNWYPDFNVRLMANYIHARADDARRGRAVDADIFEGRLQIAY